MEMTLTNATLHEGSPDKLSLLTAVKPYISVSAVVVTGGMLVAAIFFTLYDPAWIAFLGGVLLASVLAMSTQAVRTEITAESRGQRLTLAGYQLSREAAQRGTLELQLASATARLHYADVSLPALLAFVDASTRVQYHNRAFGQWRGLQGDRIDGHHLRDVLGRSVFSGIEPYMAEAAAGRVVRFERAHTGPDGTPRRFAVQFLPQTGGDGNYAGFHIVMTRIADHEDETVRLPAAPAAANEWQEAGKRVLAAINGNEFSLFCQRIAPVNPGDTGTGHHEILIRLLEEESGLVPPGVFFSLAEEHGLLPQLDQWVLAHVLDWMATPAGAASVRAGEMCFVNVAAATLADPGFPEFVEFQLRRTGVAGTAVCFEISEPDLLLHQAEAVTFAHLIRECGCRIALSGFGRNRLAMDVLKLVPVDFLKIDSGIVRQLAAYPVQLGKAVAICKLAKAIGVRTIAEMVEDPATLALLREAGVDYAQGFGIALPERLGDMQAVSPAPAAPSLRYAA